MSPGTNSRKYCVNLAFVHLQLLQLICDETADLNAQHCPLPMQKELGGQHVYCPLFGPEQQL